MERALHRVCAWAAAALLAACGGGSDDTTSTATAQANVADARVSNLAIKGMDAGVSKVDRRLAAARGPVEVWVTLDQDSLARKRALLAAEPGMQRQRASQRIEKGGTEAASVRARMKGQQGSIASQQAKTASLLATVGAAELARVSVAHNAIAVRVDAAQLETIAAMPGVAGVRPVLTYQKMLGETVPYVGAARAQALGFDGTGVRIAVLDSGLDYTHRNLGGPGTVAAYNECYAQRDVAVSGNCAALFGPAAPKVVGGFDFVGEAWPNGPRTEDPNPIDFEGHGTHVADIAAGRSADGTHRGMAPGAKILAVKVCSAVASSCNGIALLKGMDFALDPNGDGDLDDAADVINLSLGSDYGQIEDDLSLAVSNAVALGTVVAAAAGNGSNKIYNVSSPSIAPGAISVAQSNVPSDRVIPLVITAPAALAGTYANTAQLPWAPITAAVSGQMTYVGRGCNADAYPTGAVTAGRVLLIDRGSCVISEKVAKAAANGAIAVVIGLVAAGDAVSFSQGSAGPFVPSLVIQQVLSSRIKTALAAGTAVQVTLSPANGIALVGSIVSTSSRGPSISGQSIKPEISAPGASLSAEVGTGDGNTVFGGTSGASPMVAGAAALMVQAHPHASALLIKALLMNSAETAVFTNRALAPGVRAPVTRTGAGELRVDRALALKTAAWDHETLSSALSFGTHDVSRNLRLKRTLILENLGKHRRHYTAAVKFRDAADEASGAVTLRVASRFAIDGGEFEELEVEMRIDPAKLASWQLNGGSLGGNGAALDGPEFDGAIEITDGQQTISVPWHVLPRKAARTVALPWAPGQGNVLRLRNTGADVGEFDLYSLTGVSPRLPAAQRPRPGDNFALIDLQHVGVRYLPAAVAGVDVIEFAISMYERRAHPLYPAGLDVSIDTNGDGVADFVVFQGENGGFGATGQSVVGVLDVAKRTTTVVSFNDADLNSGVQRYLVPMSALGLAPGATITFSVDAYDNYYTGEITDSIAGMRFTPGASRISAAEPFGGVPVGGATSGVPFTRNPAVPAAKSTELGVMLTYRANAGQESQAVMMFP